MKVILLVATVVVGVVVCTVVLVSRTLVTMLSDWIQAREFDKIQAESEVRRANRKEANAARLANGCDHVFDNDFGEFPPGVCSRCGMEREKPSGGCDHAWKRSTGPVPGSYCEKCGKKHGGAVTV